MTAGIYAIYWEEQDLIYIGQSQDIKQRFIAHKSLFKRGHYNYKLRKAYTEYGEPQFLILEECPIIELNSKEITYIEEFNSIYMGLNINSGGDSNILGYTSGKCKNTKEEIVSAFLMLLNPSNTLENIKKATGLSFSTIESIKYGKRHHWLKEEFPDEVLKMSEMVKSGVYQSISQENRFKTYAILVSPEGQEYLVTNASKFAREHSLNKGHTCSLIRGEISHHKHWTLKERRVINE